MPQYHSPFLPAPAPPYLPPPSPAASPRHPGLGLLLDDRGSCVTRRPCFREGGGEYELPLVPTAAAGRLRSAERRPPPRLLDWDRGVGGRDEVRLRPPPENACAGRWRCLCFFEKVRGDGDEDADVRNRGAAATVSPASMGRAWWGLRECRKSSPDASSRAGVPGLEVILLLLAGLLPSADDSRLPVEGVPRLEPEVILLLAAGLLPSVDDSRLLVAGVPAGLMPGLSPAGLLPSLPISSVRSAEAVLHPPLPLRLPLPLLLRPTRPSTPQRVVTRGVATRGVAARGGAVRGVAARGIPASDSGATDEEVELRRWGGGELGGTSFAKGDGRSSGWCWSWVSPGFVLLGSFSKLPL